MYIHHRYARAHIINKNETASSEVVNLDEIFAVDL
jgi:hypothetical protein